MRIDPALHWSCGLDTKGQWQGMDSVSRSLSILRLCRCWGIRIPRWSVPHGFLSISCLARVMAHMSQPQGCFHEVS
jgi:hypothetical protein